MAQSRPRYRFLKKLAILLMVFVALSAAGWHWVFRVLPQKDPSGEMTRENIMALLSGETRVYYRDGRAVLGAFFDVNHRVYVPYDSIPPRVIQALVAAEDARFFEHGGFDWRGLARATWNNLRAGKLVQGGSTLTQQTAKNIFGRERRSLGEKWKELVYALRLEHHFTKQEILEFYLNQFYVSGTGRGLAIAAWYFFSKDLEDLSLAECAFIAGSVKGPARYDPFVQKTPQAREAALQRAHERLRYVLERMLKEGYITREMRDEALARPLNFRMGQFRFSMTTPMDRIAEKLESPFYKALFDSLGIDAWQKAQLSVISTLDQRMQESAVTALQNALADLQMALGGFVLPENLQPDRVHRAGRGEFLLGRVDSVAYKPNQMLQSIYLDFGLLKGVVPAAEVDTFARRVRSNPVQVLSRKLVPGAVLLVRVLDTAMQDGRLPCRLETEPQIQGALGALERGQFLASVGGFHNTGYDRVNKALRQFGSAWKPLLFALACKLGWRYTDVLDNDWDLFEYQGKIYKPRPDHEDRGLRVSMVWAAARSENLASIWLLEHLLDRLSLPAFLSVARRNDFLRRDNESAEQWRVRLRDSLGLVFNQVARAEVAWMRAREATRRDWLLRGWTDKAWDAQNLSYGSAAVKELSRLKSPSPEVRRRYEFNYLGLYPQVQARLAAEARGEVLPPADSVLISRALSLRDFLEIVSRMENPDAERDLLAEDSTLYFWPEFRRALAYAEFRRFCRELGITRPLQAVPSMPLGVNSIPLAELLVAYQSLLTGRQYRCLDGQWGEPCWIAQIRDRHGVLLFENRIEERRVLDDSVSAQIALMLREVIESGTGKRAYADLVLKPSCADCAAQYFPAVGKTGTTNDYRNVVFVGGVPSWDSLSGDFRFSGAVSAAVYVGYDDNRVMKGRGLRVAGASGALPPWVAFIGDLLVIRGDAERVRLWERSGEVPWHLPGVAGEWVVDALSGLPVGDDGRSGVVVVPWLDLSMIPNEDALSPAQGVNVMVEEPLPEWGEPDAEVLP